METEYPCAALFSRIAELEEEYVGFLADICRIESPTEHKAGVDAVGQYFIKKAEARGWKVEVFPQPVSGDVVCITMNPDAAGASVCYSGHMDTVHPIGSFGDEPVRIENGRLYGPGAIDCKGGLVSSFLAMAALGDCGFTARPVKLILQSDEENSSRFSDKGTVESMCKAARGSAVVLNVEPGSRKNALIRRKGICRYVLTVQGKAAHSSMCDAGHSAIREAAYKIIEFEKYKDRQGITMNCGLIVGGSAENTVPEFCRFTVDVRSMNTAQMEYADRLVRGIAERSTVEGTTCGVKLASRRCPMELCERNERMFARMNEIFAENGMPTLEAVLGFGGSDASDFTAHGLTCIDSLGTFGGELHDRGEWCEIASIGESAKRLAAIAWSL